MTEEKKVVGKTDTASVHLVNYVIDRADEGDPRAQFALSQFQKDHPEAFNTDPNRAKLYELADPDHPYDAAKAKAEAAKAEEAERARTHQAQRAQGRAAHQEQGEGGGFAEHSH